MAYTIVRKEEVREEDALAVAKILQQFNLDNGPEPAYSPLLLTVEDEHGTIAGGLVGRMAYNWLFVEWLVVPERARRSGLGSKLMAQAEAIARDAGCVGVWLDTFYFQALPFYMKLGYTVFAELEQRGDGSQYFLKKKFGDAA